MDNPMVSIVMPSLNQARFIEEAIESVLTQDYAPIELIVSDGGSTDDTLEILRTFSKLYDNIFWTSHPDDGPSDAISSALSQVRGEVIGWLNSDDRYTAGTIRKVVASMREHPDLIMCYGRGSHIDLHGNKIGTYPTQRPEIGLRGFDAGCFICQPTVFFKTAMLTIIGSLDTNFKTAFDYEYWIRAFKAFPERIGFVDSVLAHSRLHEDCITERLRETVALEGLAIGNKHLGGAKLHWAATYLEELKSSCGNDSGQFNQKIASFVEAANPFLTKSQLHEIENAANQLNLSLNN